MTDFDHYSGVKTAALFASRGAGRLVIGFPRERVALAACPTRNDSVGARRTVDGRVHRPAMKATGPAGL
jgi:hypothetical protein